ncbi:fatty-acyl-CoA synthase [Sphingopyxis sp. YR583]|uniref:AMP-binding protein n=1 Tax=Sphingopyxis sp. YR583 TaxID=1881047 RepID=UPI0008A78251|nr:AMP-binding protein [Sphingopyxis sp. YR583]SEH19180.1 fatty-acyl-CoA synthase [Sphingopyxis sp. YR583]
MQEDFLRNWALQVPDRPAVIVDGLESVSFAELDRRSTDVARRLRGAGLRDGDVIAMLMPNNARTIEIWWGARRAGVYYVPLSTRLTPDELAYLIDDSEARLLVSSADLTSLATDALGKTATGKCRLVTDDLLELDLVNAEAASTPLAIGREIIYSSGTTGRPKGIKRPLATMAQSLELPPFETILRAHFKLREGIRFLLPSPLYHAMGRFANRAIEVGGTAVILTGFDPEASLAAIERHRVTHSLWVPTMFNRLLALAPDVRDAYDLSSHRFALHAAAPCRVPVKRAMIDWWGPIVHEFYGGSENAGVTFIRAEDWLNRPGSVGRALIGRLHILDEDSEDELPIGETGMIYFEGGVPYHYIDGTPARISTSGHGSYGDLGWVDEDGFLFISDRRDDLIIVGGVNVSPLEIEELFATHPAVADIAVVGVPHDDFGQQIVAVVVAATNVSGDAALAAELLDLPKDRLASSKWPRSVLFLPELPRNEHGKLLKRVLRSGILADPLSCWPPIALPAA